MSQAKQIGKFEPDSAFNGAHFYREADGTVWASEVDHPTIYVNYNPRAVALFDPSKGETLEGFISALRAACADPRQRVIDAARAAVESYDPETDEWETDLVKSLREAVEALDEADDEDEADDAE